VRSVGWVLGPLDRAAKDRQYPIQFSLADFLCLFVQAQLALGGPALLFRHADRRDQSAAIIVMVFVTALSILLWWSGVRTLSRAGVHGTLARALTLTIVIPFGYVSSIAVALVPLGIIVSFFGSRSESWLTGLFMLIEAGLIILVVGLGFATRRIAATARHEPSSSDPTQLPEPMSSAPTPLMELVRSEQTNGKPPPESEG
jgi:hypothetical protein